MRRSPFGLGWSPLDDLRTPSPPTRTSFVLPLLLDDDDEPEDDTTTKRTMSEKDLPSSVKEKLERKRRK